LLGSYSDSNREKQMNSNKIKFACITVFALAAANAFAQSSGADSSSSTNSTTSSSATSQGGGSSMNTVGSNSSARGGTANLNNSGNSRINVTVVAGNTSSPSTGGTSGTGATANDALSPFNTQTQENVSYSGTQTVKTNPAIQAPGLTTTLSDTCMGSVSFGFSAPGFGATAGSTLVDQACVRRLDAREFRAMGLTDVALALLCQSDANRRAVESTGHLCPGTTKPLAKVDGSPTAEASVTDDVKYRDPLVRQRMGLPPLDQSAAVQAAAAKQAQQAPVAPTPVAKQEAAPAVVSVPVSVNPPLTATPPVAPAPEAKADSASEPVQTTAVPDAEIKTQELAPSPTKVANPEPAAQMTPAAVQPADTTQATPAPANQNATPATQPVPTSTTSQNQDWNAYSAVVAKLAQVR
jgi:hypothetical protein